MKALAPKLARCAIYTRKSTEHNLDLAFNSLDAQREACEAYIKSQAHEGWRLVPDRYDDGGLSGASLDRPALQALLLDLRARKIDVVVVYKVDRLTRSLADFAKLVELFDAHAASFVSVTQHFNTTSSMGRLTLNVLLSFAQFEREVIGERVRDKIAASKRKGIWVGGPVPLGYASVNKKLVVVPEQAERVRMLFSRYLALGSVGALAAELHQSGVRTKRKKPRPDQPGDDAPISVGALAHFLKNRMYIGEVVYRDEIHRGEHQPILDRALFDAVQEKLAANAVDRKLALRSSPALLTGRIYDDRGNRMTPTHANKQGVRYRYYVSHPVLQKRTEEAGSVRRVPAPEIEERVVEAIRAHLAAQGNAPASSLPDCDLVGRHLHSVTVRKSALALRVRDGHTDACIEELNAAGLREREGGNVQARADKLPIGSDLDDAPEGQVTALEVAWSQACRRRAQGVLHAPDHKPALQPETRDALLQAIAKARRWIADLAEGRAASFEDIAARENKVERHVRNLASLAFVSPRIVASIVEGSAPAALTITGLAQALPYSWAEQEPQIGAVRLPK